MRTLLLSLALVLVVATPASARTDRDYGFQIDLATSARAAEDAGVIQFALPRKARIKVGGRKRNVPVRGFTASGPESARTILRRLRGRHPRIRDALVERPLTSRERRYAGSALVWIDADVLAVNLQHPLCASGASIAQIRSLLSGSERGYAPAGLADQPERLFGLTQYGPAIEIVSEQSAIAAVARDAGAFAAVAWSAARERIATGDICAVAINGVTPTEETLRDRSYGAAVHMTYAYSRAAYRGVFRYVPRWYRSFLRSARIEALLRSARGRERLLP